MTATYPWQNTRMLSSRQFSTGVPEHAQRYLAGLRELNPDVEYSARVGSTNTVIKEAHHVDLPAYTTHKGYVPARSGMLHSTHAFVDAQGQVFHPENVGHRVPVDEALSKAREDGKDSYKGGYLWR